MKFFHTLTDTQCKCGKQAPLFDSLSTLRLLMVVENFPPLYSRT